MDKSYSSSSNFYNIYYKDDKNKKHITFNLTQKDLNFIFSYYGKDNVYSIEKQPAPFV